MYKVRKINFGWYHRKHGILLENLPPTKRDLLLEHNHMKWLDSDVQAFEVIFKIEDQNEHERNLKKVYWNPFKENFTSLKQVKIDSDWIDWNCAICNTEIKSNINFSNIENFVCKSCSESHNSDNQSIDKRIIKSTQKFINYSKNELKREQKEFMKYSKKKNKKI